MTSYHIVAPVVLVRFQDAQGVFFHGWSPRRYGPAYTYDILLEGEDNQHPAMNMEYTDLVRRIFGILSLTQEPSVVDMTTDFHCPIPLEERGEQGFVITFRDGPFSPVFFSREDAVLYLEHVQQEFGASFFALCTFSHDYL